MRMAGWPTRACCRGATTTRRAIAVAYARIGNQARDLDRDFRIFGDLSHPVRSDELVLELTYQAQMTPWWTLQADLQFVIHPGGGVQNADGRCAGTPWWWACARR